MKIVMDESIEIEFDGWNLQQAEKVIEHVKGQHRERADGVLKALCTLLLMGQIERAKPGTVGQLLSAAQDVAKSLERPQPTE